MSDEMKNLPVEEEASGAPTEAPEDLENPEELEDTEVSEAEEYEDDEYEEETPEEVVYATTKIDAALLDLLSRAMARAVTKKDRTTYLVSALVALVGGFVLAALGQSAWGMLCVIISLFLFWRLYASSEGVTRKNLEKYNGLQWDYTVDKQGVHVGKTVNDRYNPWNLIKRGWLEGDYYLMEVPGSVPIAIQRSSLSSSEQNLLELLMLENLKSCTL